MGLVALIYNLDDHAYFEGNLQTLRNSIETVSSEESMKKAFKVEEENVKAALSTSTAITVTTKLEFSVSASFSFFKAIKVWDWSDNGAKEDKNMDTTCKMDLNQLRI